MKNYYINNRAIKIFLILLLSILPIFLSGCSSNEITLTDKAKSEIDYFDAKFIYILNRLNNITFENYNTTAVKANLSSKSAENEKQTEESSNVASVEGTTSKKNTIVSYQMSPNTILNPVTDKIDWSGIKNEIENIYYSWNTVLLDLYDLDVKNEDILEFSKDLDVATKYIKNEDKANSILALTNLYKYLPKYAEQVSDDLLYINLYKTKLNILKAYSFIEVDGWDLANKEIDNSLDAFKLISNNTNYIGYNTYRINKVYVILNEIKNSLNLKDKEIFYIKYKNLMEEITEIKHIS